MPAPRLGDRLAHDPDTGELVVDPRGPWVAVSSGQEETYDEGEQIYADIVPHPGVTWIGRVCSPASTTDAPTSTTTLDPDAICPVRVYDVVIVRAEYPEETGERLASALTRYDRRYKAAAHPDWDVAEGDLVALFLDEGQLWIFQILSSCGESCPTTSEEPTTSTSTTKEPPTTTSTSTTEPPTTTSTSTTEPPTTTSTSTTEPPTTTSTTEEPTSTTTEEPTTTSTTSTTTEEPTTTSTTSTTTKEPTTTSTTSTTTEEPGTTTSTTTEEPGTTTSTTTEEPGSTTTTTTEEPVECDVSFDSVPELQPGEEVEWGLVLTTEGCLRKVPVRLCDLTTTTQPP